jgi:translocation and assembly module TamB
VSINLDLTDDITARGSVDSDGNTSLGIFFERDY